MEMLFIFIMVADTWVCKTAKQYNSISLPYSPGSESTAVLFQESPIPDRAPPRTRNSCPAGLHFHSGRCECPAAGAQKSEGSLALPSRQALSFRFYTSKYVSFSVDQGGVTGDPSPRGELRADLKTRAGAQCSPLLSYTSNKRPLWAVSLSFPDPAVAPKVCEGKIACVLGPTVFITTSRCCPGMDLCSQGFSLRDIGIISSSCSSTGRKGWPWCFRVDDQPFHMLLLLLLSSSLVLLVVLLFSVSFDARRRQHRGRGSRVPSLGNQDLLPCRVQILEGENPLSPVGLDRTAKDNGAAKMTQLSSDHIKRMVA
nr:uncharacterized protein LOC109027174 [Gorilla gorilla gorilla]